MNDQYASGRGIVYPAPMKLRMALLIVLLLPAGQLRAQSDTQPKISSERLFVTTSVEKRRVAGESRIVTHTWLLEQRGRKFTLWHRTNEDTPGDLYKSANGNGHIESIAAFDAQLVLAYEGRTVQSITYQPLPPPQAPQFPDNRLPILPEGRGRCEIAAGTSGVFALIFAPNDSSPGAALGATLLRLAGFQWEAMTLPDDFVAKDFLSLLAPMEAGAGPILVTRDETGGGIIVRRWTENGVQNEFYSITSPPGMLRFALVSYSGVSNIVAARQVTESGGDILHIDWLRKGTTTPLAKISLDAKTEQWWIGEVDNGLALITRESDDNIFVTKIPFPDGLDEMGKVSWIALQTGTRPLKIDPITTLLFVAMFIGILVLLFSGRRVGDPRGRFLPRGLRPAGVSRLVAAVLDFLPGLIGTMYYYEISDPLVIFEPLAQRPNEIEEMMPLLVAIGSHVGQTMLLEVFTGRTIGKLIFGCRVISQSGKRPNPAQVLLRNLFKAVEVIAWPLILVAFITPTGQRLGDIVSRTVVVMPAPPDAPDLPDLIKPPDSSGPSDSKNSKSDSDKDHRNE